MRSTASSRLVSAAAAISLAALGSTSVVATVPAAAAACSPTTIVDALIRDPKLVVGTTNTRTIDMIVEVKDTCTVNRVDISLRSPRGGQSFRADKLGSDGDYSVWGVSVDLTAADLLNDEAGSWTSAITAKGSSTATEAGPRFRVLRNARASLDAHPEPVRRGQKLTVSARVERANWETEKYVGYPDRPVDLQWRAAGTTTYTSIKALKTGAKGVLATTITASRDGCYRLVFRGSPVTGGATSKADCVDVR